MLNFQNYYEEELPGIQFKKEWSENISSPFRDDKTPSFGANCLSGYWKDFGEESGSVFDFHMRKYGVDFPTAVKQLAERSGLIFEQEAHQPAKRSEPENPVFKLLRDKRGLSEYTVQLLLDSGKIHFQKYAGKDCVAVPFKTIEGETLATQFLTIDQQPFEFTINGGKPVNKIFGKGSKPGEECFFFAGASLKHAREIIITESVINAMTASQWFPDACCVALGGSTYTRKVKALMEHINRIDRVFIAQDNDQAGRNMVNKIHEILCGVRYV